MKISIIGGIGFLGVNLAEVLIALGHEVTVTGRIGSDKKRPQIAAHLEKIGAKISLYPAVSASALEKLGSDVYVYTIGKISGSLEEFREAHASLLGEAISAASALGSRLVYVSSIGAVGGIEGVKPGSVIYEEEELLSGKRSHWSHYEVTKAEGERLLYARGGELKGRWSIVRPGFLVGPWGYHVEWRLFKRLLPLRLAPATGVGLPIVHVRDVAEILAEAAEGKYDSKWLFAVSPYYPDFSDLMMTACKLTGRRCVRIPMSPFTKLGIAAAPLLLRLIPRGTVLSLALSQARFRYRFMSRIVKREWRGVEEMVRDLLAWHGALPAHGAAAGI